MSVGMGGGVDERIGGGGYRWRDSVVLKQAWDDGRTGWLGLGKVACWR